MGPILEDRDYEMSHGAKGLAVFSKRIINSKVGGGAVENISSTKT